MRVWTAERFAPSTIVIWLSGASGWEIETAWLRVRVGDDEDATNEHVQEVVDALNEKEDRRVMVCDCIDSEPHVHISDIEGGIRTVIHT